MRLRPTTVLVHTLMLWVTLGIAATTLWPIYQSPRLPILVAVTVILGSVIGILGAVYRWSSIVVLGASVLVFLLVGVPLAVPDKAMFGVLPSLEGLRDLVTGVALGWKQLITISLPVGQYEALLVPAFVLMLVSSVVGLTIALRARVGEAAALAPAGVFITGIAFGPESAQAPRLTALSLLAVVILWFMWFGWVRRRAAIRRLAARAGGASLAAARGTRLLRSGTLAGAVLILAVSSGGALFAAAALPPTTDRTVLRTSIERPFDPRDYASPLSGFRNWWRPATVDETLFTLDGLPEGTRVRLATLDTWDGVVYSVGSGAVTSESGLFSRVPYRLDQSAAAGSTVTVTVLIDGYSGVWVPTVGQLESISFTGDRAADLRSAFYYNDTSGSAAVIGGLGSGDSYGIVGVVAPEVAPGELARLTPGAASVPTAADAPPELLTALDAWAADATSPGERLVAAIAGLQRDGYISHGLAQGEPASRSGHAADRIAQLFTDPRMIGDAEQYAVAAALMARELGFPARVVLGFEPKGTRVTGGDVAAWIEVNAAGRGWVAIDVTPEVRPIPEEPPEEPAHVARPPTIVPPPVTESERVERQPTPESSEDPQSTLDPVLELVLAVARVVGVALAGIAIVLAPFLLVIAAKVRRRRLRRSSPSAAARISGGWREFEDAVIDHGIPTPSAATRSEVAAAVGGAQPIVLATVADRAIFAPDEPDAAEADEVWRAVDELRESLDGRVSRWQRIRALVSVRSLGGYGFTRRLKR